MRRIARKPTLAALVSLGLVLFGWQGVAEAAGVPGTWTQTQVNAATQAGVAYIDSHQNPNGSFGAIFPIAETGMALVAYSVVQNGSFSNLSPSYQTHVKNAITWLLGQQQPSGWWADFSVYKTYGTGIALAGLSAFTTVNAGVPGAISNGRTFLINEFQGPPLTACSSADGSPTSTYCGGWNYAADPGRSDESNTGFAMFGLRLTGGVPAANASVNIGWQHHIQEISSNPFATRNDGGGSYEPFITGGSFSSNANDTGTLLFGLAYDGVPGTDPNVKAGLKIGQDVLDVYELEAPAIRNMVFHSGATEDGSCLIGSPGCDWNFAGGEGGYHYSIFSLTKGLGEYIAPNLNDATNWYAKVVDLLLTQQSPTIGSWPQDGRDDGTTLMATAFAVASLGLVAVEQPISNAKGVPVSTTEGTPFCGSVATFDDADQNAVAGDYTAMIDWGDTTTSAGTVSGGNTHFTVSGCHTYTEEGTFIVKVTITDADSSQNSATATATAIVSDATLFGGTCATPTASGQVFAGPTATFNDNDQFGMSSDYNASIDWGDSSTSPGVVTGGPGHGPYAVNGAHTYTSTGFFTVTSTIRDTGGAPPITVTCSNVVIFAFAPGGGSFVIGDLNSAIGTAVTFWGAQWAKDNSLSGGAAPRSFKGFAENPTTPSCGTGWTADPGNSTPPPDGPLPDFMGVIVTSSADKSGPTISGNTVQIVVVQTNPGYAPNPGHAGTGTVVAVVC